MQRSSLIFLVFIFLLSFNGYSKIRNPFKRPSIIMLTLQSNGKPSDKDNVKALLNSLSLSGILNNEIAVINHQFYRQGDKIKIFTIKKITDNNVILTANDKEYELILNLEKEIKEVKDDKKTLNKEHYK